MDGRSPVLATLGLGTLAFNSALALYKSWGNSDTGSVAFVLAANAALLLLFLCLRQLERARGGGEDRNGRIKAAVWTLTTLLTVIFASRVAPLMPPVVGAVVWAMAVGTAAAGFWAFFLNRP